MGPGGRAYFSLHVADSIEEIAPFYPKWATSLRRGVGFLRRGRRQARWTYLAPSVVSHADGTLQRLVLDHVEVAREDGLVDVYLLGILEWDDNKDVMAVRELMELGLCA